MSVTLACESALESGSRLSVSAASETLRDLQKRRLAFGVVTDMAARLKNGNTGAEVLAAARTGLDAAQAGVAGSVRVVTVSDTVDARRAEYEDQEKNPNKYRGVLLGIDELDKITNGIYPQETMLIVGRQGSGKTRVLFNLAYNVARTNHVAFFTIEMPAAQIQRIYSSRDAMVDYLSLKTAKLNEKDREKYFETLERQRESAKKFHIVDMPRGCSASAVESQVRALLSAFSIKLIVIDYIGLMESSRQWRDSWKEVEQIGRELKQLSRALQIPIISAAQGNRDMAKALKDGEEVGLENVALSDRLSDHADIIILIHASQADVMGGVLHWNVAKHRDGTRSQFDTFFLSQCNFIGNRVVELGNDDSRDRKPAD